MSHRPVPEKICNACPFRRASLPGWLGAASPEDFVTSILHEEPLPCHQSIDYQREDWKEAWRAARRGKMCRGALIFATNIGKRARNRAIIPVLPANDELVFSTAQAFIDHHRSTKNRSWEY